MEDLGITYDEDVQRLMQEFESRGLYVGSVVLTHYAGQIRAAEFKERLEKKNVKVYLHYTNRRISFQYPADRQ